MSIRTITLSGELGSGKSSVSELLAHALDARRVSTGDVQRGIAERRGISTLDLNLQSESDPTIDEEIDSVFRALSTAREALVVDSRLAWHFLPNAYKVHLVVDPEIAAERVLGRAATSAEHYESLAEAQAMINERVESERRRFKSMYGIDIFSLTNYDLVVDTSHAAPDVVTEGILSSVKGPRTDHRPLLLLDPQRVDAPREDVDPEVHRSIGTSPSLEGSDRRGIVVGYRRPEFFLLDGAEFLEASRRQANAFVEATLG